MLSKNAAQGWLVAALVGSGLIVFAIISIVRTTGEFPPGSTPLLGILAVGLLALHVRSR